MFNDTLIQGANSRMQKLAYGDNHWIITWNASNGSASVCAVFDNEETCDIYLDGALKAFSVLNKELNGWPEEQEVE